MRGAANLLAATMFPRSSKGYSGCNGLTKQSPAAVPLTDPRLGDVRLLPGRDRVGFPFRAVSGSECMEPLDNERPWASFAWIRP